MEEERTRDEGEEGRRRSGRARTPRTRSKSRKGRQEAARPRSPGQVAGRPRRPLRKAQVVDRHRRGQRLRLRQGRRAGGREPARRTPISTISARASRPAAPGPASATSRPRSASCSRRTSAISLEGRFQYIPQPAKYARFTAQGAISGLAKLMRLHEAEPGPILRLGDRRWRRGLPLRREAGGVGHRNPPIRILVRRSRISRTPCGRSR